MMRLRENESDIYERRDRGSFNNKYKKIQLVVTYQNNVKNQHLEYLKLELVLICNRMDMMWKKIHMKIEF